MKNQRGLTLIELMIVVAILGILAGLATVAYGRYIKGAQVEKLRQIALEIQSGQERYRSRNNVYYNAGVWSGVTKANYSNLLDFGKDVPPDTTVTTEAWTGAAGTCTICAGGPYDDSVAGYAVRVEKDMNTASPVQTTVLVTHVSENPLVLNEGE